ncbi:FMN-dependent NADH-azoreductase [Gimesia aquarii]|uniref:FMN dependent NADH:quinone oxidoreductase n=1 Tax=Gimesia aquarii TaxID=2527964 RepID=A0A517VQT3_9PLAN|nr:NAD(P)H-dependent oxidoreductase [Gimesia aquarii]MDF1747062.1 NAD(P)H-dependent oxidoreductase [Gimesia sp.]QDT95372.1 FMN-dependent NADH-azoreductase 1 [Gimesia aquarii]
MTTILQLNASARGERSLSRKLSSHFVREWIARCPNDIVIERDVGRNAPSPVSEEWIASAFTPHDDRTKQQRELLAVSDKLIAEVANADIILIGTPMYNYGMPSSLKAWFDQVIRINKTFSFDLERGDNPLEPIFSGKTLVILTSTGEFGFATGGVRAHMNHLVPHIKTCSFYLGVNGDDSIHHVGIEYQEFGDERHRKSIDDAHDGVAALVELLVSNG